VTGATGLIGSTDTRLLRSGGDEAVALSRNRGRSRCAGPGTALRADSPAVRTLRHQTREEPVSDLQAIADRVEIEALRGEFTDAVMMHDYDRLAALFTHDGAVRIPHINAEAVSREEMRAGIERLQALLDYFAQNHAPGHDPA
jgi:NAD(P)-dependent dehydrogenase (short-subunit alcohol dehydrogenase family)